MSAPVHLTDEQRLDWLRLIRSDNVGPRTFHFLLRQFGSARKALDAIPDLARRGGAQRAIRICAQADAVREMETARRLGAVFIASCEDGYPQRLATIDDAPPLIAVRGNFAALARPMIAIVGSRNASAASLKFAERLSRELGEAGLVVASGLARGIDAAAHRATLATGTVAMLAGGHDRIYPSEHKGLLDALLPEGAAISEMPFGWEPRAQDFPRRNRLISGAAVGVVITEAAKRSGSLITARFALEQGREVFAVPGSPIDPRAEGTNGLLKQGATMVTDADDVLSVIEPILGQQRELLAREPDGDEPSYPGEPDDRTRTVILELLGPTPVILDDLVRLSNLTPAAVRIVLLELELAGRIERHAGGLVSLA